MSKQNLSARYRDNRAFATHSKGISIDVCSCSLCKLILFQRTTEAGDLQEPCSCAHLAIFCAGGESFVYQSCVSCSQMGGFMEGTFTFIEGTLQSPDGPTFEAQVRS